jgi:mono/diheme cytochrome c family protein
MSFRSKAATAIVAVFAAAVGISACGTRGIQLAKSNPDYAGAELFLDHCSGCHTLAVVGAEGSATSIRNRLKTNGPNFDQRKEQYSQVIYAIENGGFSGAIMPENIVVGNAAIDIAHFLAKYSGLKAQKTPTVNLPTSGPGAVGGSPGASG